MTRSNALERAIETAFCRLPYDIIIISRRRQKVNTERAEIGA